MKISQFRFWIAYEESKAEMKVMENDKGSTMSFKNEQGIFARTYLAAKQLVKYEFYTNQKG